MATGFLQPVLIVTKNNTIYKIVTKLKSESKCDDLFNYKEIEKILFPLKKGIFERIFS
jgi:hypothetical protein